MDSCFQGYPLVSSRGEGVQDGVTAAQMTPLPLGRPESGARATPTGV